MLKGVAAFAAVFVFSFWVFAEESSENRAPTIPNQKDWTILVYLNADNNLESFGYDDIREMERVGSADAINVVVQFDRVSPSGSPRFLVEKNSRPYTERRKSFNSTIIDDLPEKDMGDYRTLIEFAQWGIEKFPAKHYAIVMWNHGSGWKKEDEATILKGVSYDDTSGNHITTLQLVEAMKAIKEKAGKKIDVIAFDACLMSMVEVVDGLTPYADYMVASEETIPGMGYPYDRVLRTFSGREEKPAKALVSDLVMEYGMSYTGGSQGSSNVTLAGLDLSQFDAFKRKFNSWVDSLETRSNLATDVMKTSASASLAFDDSDFRDLGDYVSILLQKKLDSEGMTVEQVEATRGGFIGNSLALLDALDRVVIENFTTQRYRKARGLSIYLPYAYGSWSPWSSRSSSDVALKNEYLRLSWTTSTPWSSHLDRLFPSL